MRRSGSTRESGVREGILNRLSESYRILTRANPAVHDAEESMDMTVSKGTSATVAESKAAVPFSTAEDQSGADSRLSAFLNVYVYELQKPQAAWKKRSKFWRS